MHGSSLALLGATLAGVLSAGCLKKSDSSKDTSANDANTTPWTFTSPDFDGGAALPDAFTCNGGDFASGTNPELDWTAGPSAAKSYAIVLKDISITEKMDARSDGYAWAIWDIPATARQIPQALGIDEFPGALAGARQWSLLRQFGYVSPCPNSDPTVTPPANVTDHYAFTLYAVPTTTVTDPKFDPDQPNYVQTLDDHLKEVALQDLELLFTSDATSTSPPPPLDPSTVAPPSGDSASAGDTGGAGGVGNAVGAAGN